MIVPCHWCGNPNVHVERVGSGATYYVACFDGVCCYARSPEAESEAEAIRKHNAGLPQAPGKKMIVCTATTRLSYAEVLARLEHVRTHPVPIGERIASQPSSAFGVPRLWSKLARRGAIIGSLMSCWSPGPPPPSVWRHYARPLRKLRRALSQRDEAISHLNEVVMGDCDTSGRWCLTHRTNNCAQAEARRFLDALRRDGVRV